MNDCRVELLKLAENCKYAFSEEAMKAVAEEHGMKNLDESSNTFFHQETKKVKEAWKNEKEERYLAVVKFCRYAMDNFEIEDEESLRDELKEIFYLKREDLFKLDMNTVSDQALPLVAFRRFLLESKVVISPLPAAFGEFAKRYSKPLLVY